MTAACHSIAKTEQAIQIWQFVYLLTTKTLKGYYCAKLPCDCLQARQKVQHAFELQVQPYSAQQVLSHHHWPLQHELQL